MNNSIVESYYDNFRRIRSDEKESIGIDDILRNLSLILCENWTCHPEPIGGEGIKGMAETIIFFSKFIPDFSYEVQDTYTSGKAITVRSIISGTIEQDLDFLGLKAKGRSFRIQAIDIHELNEDGQISRTYRTEDWGRARTQVC